MLTLYHGDGSVCSVKVRLGLEEKGLDWNSQLLTLPAGDQFKPEYLKLNPNGVVPTLVHDDLVVIESSVILEYVDELSPENPLMPTDRTARAVTKVWLLRCLDIHAAINTMTFSTSGRETILAKKTPEQIAASIKKMPNPVAAAKRTELLDIGLKSNHVVGAFFTLKRLFDDMQVALEKTQWMTGDTFAMADVAVLAYVDRLERLGLAGLFAERTPVVANWLAAAQERPSYSAALDPFVSAETAANLRTVGARFWPEVEEKWRVFLENSP